MRYSISVHLTSSSLVYNYCKYTTLFMDDELHLFLILEDGFSLLVVLIAIGLFF